MKRRWFVPMSFTFAALVGGLSPVAACAFSGFEDESGSGSGGFGSTFTEAVGGASGTGGGPIQDGSIDARPDTDDPPPFTGKSYCDLCGGTAGDNGCSNLGCDTEYGSCSPDGGPTMSGMGCKLVPVDGGANADAICAASGQQGEGQVCATTADCGPGLGCIANGKVCRSYCCNDTLVACAAKSWCVPEHLSDSDQKVPVCIPADNCTLLDDSRPCPGELMCTVVRNDGTTACVQPGDGLDGDHCPCAPGYVCSQLADKCFKLCHVGNDADCPNGAQCVGGMGGYPAGIGNCLGGTD